MSGLFRSLRPTRKPSQPARVQLAVEALEGRAVPATFTVTNLNDDGAGSLRQAILEANNNGNNDETDAIVFQPGLTGTLTLTSGQLNVTRPVAITGPGSGALTISGNNASRIFLVDNGSAVVHNFALSGMTLTQGKATGIPVGGGIQVGSENLVVKDVVISGNTATRGGGIFVNPNGRLTLENSAVSLNKTTTDDGAGLYLSTNSLTLLRNSTVSDNKAAAGNGFGGGGVHVEGGGFLTVESTTISGNHSPGNGGGILVRPGGTLLVRNSTISGNTTDGYGGGIQLDRSPSVTIENSTISGNQSIFQGGGVWMTGTTAVIRNSTIALNRGGAFFAVNAGGGIMLDEQIAPNTLTLQGTLVAQNQRGGGTAPLQGDDILGPVLATSASNLIGDGTGLQGISHGANGNQVGTAAAALNPLLAPLASNGGPTQTHALLASSPAINSGFNFTGQGADQRGGVFTRLVGVAADIGAFEVHPPPQPTPPPPAQPPVAQVAVAVQRVKRRTRVDVLVNGSLRRRFFPFGAFKGRVEVQRVDVNGDGVFDVMARATVNGKRRTRTFLA